MNPTRRPGARGRRCPFVTTGAAGSSRSFSRTARAGRCWRFRAPAHGRRCPPDPCTYARRRYRRHPSWTPWNSTRAKPGPLARRRRLRRPADGRARRDHRARTDRPVEMFIRHHPRLNAVLERRGGAPESSQRGVQGNFRSRSRQRASDHMYDFQYRGREPRAAPLHRGRAGSTRIRGRVVEELDPESVRPPPAPWVASRSPRSPSASCTRSSTRATSGRPRASSTRSSPTSACRCRRTSCASTASTSGPAPQCWRRTSGRSSSGTWTSWRPGWPSAASTDAS